MTLRKVRDDLSDAQDNRYQVILYNPNGGSRYKKTVKVTVQVPQVMDSRRLPGSRVDR